MDTQKSHKLGLADSSNGFHLQREREKWELGNWIYSKLTIKKFSNKAESFAIFGHESLCARYVLVNVAKWFVLWVALLHNLDVVGQARHTQAHHGQDDAHASRRAHSENEKDDYESTEASISTCNCFHTWVKYRFVTRLRQNLKIAVQSESNRVPSKILTGNACLRCRCLDSRR